MLDMYLNIKKNNFLVNYKRNAYMSKNLRISKNGLGFNSSYFYIVLKLWVDNEIFFFMKKLLINYYYRYRFKNIFQHCILKSNCMLKGFGNYIFSYKNEKMFWLDIDNIFTFQKEKYNFHFSFIINNKILNLRSLRYLSKNNRFWSIQYVFFLILNRIIYLISSLII